MYSKDHDAYRRTLVVGLGRTGLSVARFLAGRGCPVAVVDSREDPPGLEALRRELPDVAVFRGGFDPAAFRRAEQLIVSPGVSIKEEPIRAARARGAEVIGDIELFARHVPAPVVAITGSNGKSTVTTLVGRMAERAGWSVKVGGNLGTPALDLLDGSVPDLYVLELSSFQLETTYSLDARAATVLNLSPDHMDRYAGMDEYAEAKRQVFHGDGVMVLNADDSRVMDMLETGREVVRFTLGRPAEGDFGLLARGDGDWLAHGSEPLLPVRRMLLAGRHNQANALAALALGNAVGLPMAAMLAALREFPGLAHRSRWVAEVNGVQFFDDSKGTNVGATVAAVRGMERPLVLIAGGEGKGQDFTPLREAMGEDVRAVVLIGRDAPLLEQALDGAVAIHHAGGMDEAVETAFRLSSPGDAVLLSPACASFDMFSNFEQRGDAFVAAVERLLT
jgi:UDP-N-acetylmuramoylalanine--D-glutamate ligase